MIKTLKLQRIGASHYNPALVIEQPIMGFNLWPGYTVHLKHLDSGIFL